MLLPVSVPLQELEPERTDSEIKGDTAPGVTKFPELKCWLTETECSRNTLPDLPVLSSDLFLFVLIKIT